MYNLVTVNLITPVANERITVEHAGVYIHVLEFPLNASASISLDNPTFGDIPITKGTVIKVDKPGFRRFYIKTEYGSGACTILVSGEVELYQQFSHIPTDSGTQKTALAADSLFHEIAYFSGKNAKELYLAVMGFCVVTIRVYVYQLVTGYDKAPITEDKVRDLIFEYSCELDEMKHFVLPIPPCYAIQILGLNVDSATAPNNFVCVDFKTR